MRRLVCTCVVRNPLQTGFLTFEAQIFLISLQSVVHDNGNLPIPPFDIRPAVLEIAKDDTVVMDIEFQPPQVKSYSVDMCMVCDNCNVKHFSIKGKHYCEPCLGNSVFGQAPEILMLVAYVSSPVVRIHSGSTDFSGL